MEMGAERKIDGIEDVDSRISSRASGGGAAGGTGWLGGAEKEITDLLGQLGSKPGYAQIQRVGNRLLKIQPPADIPASKRVRVALASSSTIDPMAPTLAVNCFRIGLWPIIKIDGFNQFLPHLLDSASEIYKFNPEIVFLAAELGSIVPIDKSKSDGRVVGEACSQLDGLIQKFRSNSSALLVIHNFVPRHEFPFAIVRDNRMNRCIRATNEWLANEFTTDPQVKVMDFEALCAYHGVSRVTNPLLHYLGSIELSETFLPILAQQYLAFIRAVKALVRKCLVLDLDGILWGGVIGEDGPEGIQLARYGPGSEYRDFQETILALHERGVILAINSKNNPDEALKVLRSHPEMVLREQHFASIRVNWDDKVSNLRSIAEEINIGLDSLVFVDDSPTERQWVSQELPEVRVFDLPADPKLYAKTLSEFTEFENLSMTAEDRLRTASYAFESARRRLQATSGSFQNFLASLRIILSIRIATPEDFVRVGQLTRKTNQFNMTSRRYPDAEIFELGTRDDVLIYILDVRDIFGEYGLVGVLILRKEVVAINTIETLLVSCRVLGRGIEHAFVVNVLLSLKDQGLSEVYGGYIPSSKNDLAASFYNDLGFERVSEKQGSTFWHLCLSRWNPPDYKYHTIEWK